MMPDAANVSPHVSLPAKHIIRVDTPVHLSILFRRSVYLIIIFKMTPSIADRLSHAGEKSM
jgi:hypothetical protein